MRNVEGAELTSTHTTDVQIARPITRIAIGYASRAHLNSPRAPTLRVRPRRQTELGSGSLGGSLGGRREVKVPQGPRLKITGVLGPNLNFLGMVTRWSADSCRTVVHGPSGDGGVLRDSQSFPGPG